MTITSKPTPGAPRDADPMPEAIVGAPRSAADRRASQRFAFFRRIHYVSNGRRLQGLVQDVSGSGVRLLCGTSMPVGTSVIVTLPRSLKGPAFHSPLQLRGYVTWQRSRAVGVRFVNPPRMLTRHISALLRWSRDAGRSPVQSPRAAVAASPERPHPNHPQVEPPDKRIIWG